MRSVNILSLAQFAVLGHLAAASPTKIRARDGLALPDGAVNFTIKAEISNPLLQIYANTVDGVWADLDHKNPTNNQSYVWDPKTLLVYLDWQAGTSPDYLYVEKATGIWKVASLSTATRSPTEVNDNTTALFKLQTRAPPRDVDPVGTQELRPYNSTEAQFDGGFFACRDDDTGKFDIFTGSDFPADCYGGAFGMIAQNLTVPVRAEG